MDSSDPVIDLTLTRFEKNTISAIVYKRLLQERIENYKNHIIVSTDGSKTDNGTGCGVFVDNENQLSVALNRDTSIFHAELTAIMLALQHFLNKEKSRILICTDSYSALKDKFTRDPILMNIFNLIFNLKSKETTVSFMWIPGHTEIEGNEKADGLAKQAAQTAADSDLLLHINDHKMKIKNLIMDIWQNEFNNNDLFLKHIVSTVKAKSCTRLDRHDDVIITRLRIGHSRLTHGHHLVGRRRPQCESCSNVLDVKHILVDCPDSSTYGGGINYQMTSETYCLAKKPQ